MDSISSVSNFNSVMNFNQSKTEQFKTQLEVETLNKSLNKDGKEPVKVMGKDEFLKLLITELQHQDPTSPMNDREFIAQMAQFSSLEQMIGFNQGMSKLVENVSFQSSFNLLGMNVEIDDAGNQNEDGSSRLVQGMVQGVSKEGETVFVRVNGEHYPLSSIIGVSH